MARIYDTSKRYGWISILFHWVTALLILTLFVLGIWMVELDYYHPWYQKSQLFHESIGVITFLIMIFRLLWRLFSKTVSSLADGWQAKASKIVHIGMYVLSLFVLVIGFQLASLEKSAVDIFEIGRVWAIPNLLQLEPDTFSQLHKYTAYLLMFLIFIHSCAALKHHFYEKNNTLKRILIPSKESK